MPGLVLGRPRMLLPTRSASETDHRLSATPDSFEERRGPPRFLGRPLRARRGPTPRRIRPLLAPTPLRGDLRRGRRRLQGKQNPRHPGSHSFRGRNPTAHTLACLRFADLVAETVARLTTGSGGLTPGRAGFAPAGRQTKFHGAIAVLQFPSTSRAWSHRFPYGRRGEQGRARCVPVVDTSDGRDTGSGKSVYSFSMGTFAESVSLVSLVSMEDEEGADRREEDSKTRRACSPALQQPRRLIRASRTASSAVMAIRSCAVTPGSGTRNASSQNSMSIAWSPPPFV